PPACSPLFPYTTLFRSDAARDLDRVVAADLVDLVPQLGVPVALGQREAVVIDLGLRVVVGGVARPAARVVHHFTEDEVGLRPVRSEEHTSELQSRSDLV